MDTRLVLPKVDGQIMDFGNPLGIEYRVVKDSEHNGEPARVVSGARTYATTCDDLWDAVTNPDRIPRWFLPVSGDFKLGGTYQLEGHAGGKITRCDVPEALNITWECGGSVSWVHLQIRPDGDGARLTLEHIMLKDKTSEDHWKKYGPGATGVGWDLGFVGLSLHLQTGETIVQEENQAWMSSEPGKIFIRKSASAWEVAHIESGEEPTTAKKMADETAKAYTGEQ